MVLLRYAGVLAWDKSLKCMEPPLCFLDELCCVCSCRLALY